MCRSIVDTISKGWGISYLNNKECDREMTTDRFEQYRRANAPLPKTNRLWPLYGAGFENLGVDGAPIEVPMPEFGPNELLVRHDACGHCFSDIKVIQAGQAHPRIYRDMSRPDRPRTRGQPHRCRGGR